MASTYVNNLRLEEIATGEKSGTWGSITNTNLELVGEALGYGTENLGSDANTTITVADGAADAARSFYLKITSTSLSADRTVTLAPNTVSKVWIIENATTGGKAITIKQGTGATIDIPNGDVKMVATDGAGAGGAVYDLLVDLNIATKLTVKNPSTSDDTPASIVLQTGDTDIAADDKLGVINFQAPDEGTGTDAVLVAAGIEAVSEGDFSSSSNATKLSFKTASSEAAAEKMSLSSAGLLTIADDLVIGDGKTIGSSTTPGAITIASDGNLSVAGSVSTDNPINNKNLLINGGQNVWQRSTSATGITSGGYHSVDRFYSDVLGSHGTYTLSRSTTVPTGQGFGYSFKQDCTTADTSIAADAAVSFYQAIEGQNLQRIKKGTSSADSLTLSFWIRSNLTGTFTAELVDLDNTRQISQAYTISSADTWEKKEITFAGDTSGALGNDNGASLYVVLWLAAGSNYTSGTLSTSWSATTHANRVSSSQVNIASSTSNEVLITGMQLEQGTAATDFEFEPYDVTLQKCQRYLYVSQYFGQSISWSQNDINDWHSYLSDASRGEAANFQFPVTLRADPTMTTTSIAGTSGKVSEILEPGGAVISDVDAHAVVGKQQSCQILEYAEQSYGILANIKADAEL